MSTNGEDVIIIAIAIGIAIAIMNPEESVDSEESGGIRPGMEGAVTYLLLLLQLLSPAGSVTSPLPRHLPRGNGIDTSPPAT